MGALTPNRSTCEYNLLTDTLVKVVWEVRLMVDSSITTALHRAGAVVTGGDSTRIRFRFNGIEADVAVARFGRVNDASTVYRRISGFSGGRVFVACESIRSEARRELLKGGGCDLFVAGTGELVINDTVVVPATIPPAGVAGNRRLRRNAILRMAVLAVESLRQQDVAAVLGVTQQAISRMNSRWPLPDTPLSPDARKQALEQLLSEAAPLAIETHWYGLETPIQLTNRVLGTASEAGIRAGVSGEVAADHLQPWRVPRSSLVYSSGLIDLSRPGLVAANPEEANVTLRVPHDITVWGTARWWNHLCGGLPTGLPTMDPVVVLRDLVALPGGEDGAPHRLNEWIVNR